MTLLGINIKISIVTLDELVYLILLIVKHETKLITFPSQSISDIDNIRAILAGPSWPMQSVPLTDKVVSSDTAHDEVYSIQLYVIKFSFRQIVVFFQTIFSVPIIFLWAYTIEVILETYYTSKRNDRNGTPYYGHKPSSIHVQFCFGFLSSILFVLVSLRPYN